MERTSPFSFLLGEEEVIAFSASGEKIWRLAGHFRKAAIAVNGKIALLNPAPTESINQVFVYDGSTDPRILRAPTPVHDLVIAPDGSRAVVVGDQGRYFYLGTADGSLAEGPSLPIDHAYSVSNAEFVDNRRIALGVLHRVGEPPSHTWPSGSIIVIDTAGNVSFQKKFPIREPLAILPAINVTFGSGHLIGYTEDTIVLVNLN